MIRECLTELLRQHRIQHRIGGPGTHSLPVSTTEPEREALGAQLRRYRHATLTWCHQAITSTRSHAATGAGPGAGQRPPVEVAADHLAYAIDRALQASTAGLPGLAELTTAQPFELVETWRTVARAAALGEHDFDAELGPGLLGSRESLTVVRDVAAITQALVILDQRYRRIPGWERLTQPAKLGWAALACALEASVDREPDYTVDRRGWRPPPTLIGGPTRPGVLGVLQAEHNLSMHLHGFPSVINLRLVVDSQRVLSRELAGLTGDVEAFATGWSARAETYDLIHHELRDISGRIGKGADAAAEGANAVSRLRSVPRDTVIDPRILSAFETLFSRVDARIADIIDRGIAERLLFCRVRAPRVQADTGAVAGPPRQRFAPVTSAAQTRLPSIVRDRLRPRPTPATPTTPTAPPGRPAPTPEAARSRSALHLALLHRPDGHGQAIGL